MHVLLVLFLVVFGYSQETQQAQDAQDDSLQSSLTQKLLKAQELNQSEPQTPDLSEPVNRSVSGLLLETVLGLAFVIVLIFLTVYLIKRLQQTKWGQDSNDSIGLEVIQTKMIGPHQRLIIARIQNDFVLLGVTNENISYLKEIDKSTLDPELLTPVAPAQEFSQTVNQLLAKFKKDPGSQS